MNIKLISGPEVNPLVLSVGSARTCYSKTLKQPADVENWDKKIDLANDLLTSGHHTTLQHANFTFTFEGVSRLAIWRFFHSHRFYNSDQISQRYAVIDSKNFYLGNYDSDHKVLDFHENIVAKYFELTALLEEDFKNSKNKVEVKNANKKAMENARYILPQSIFANMYHTINLSVLFRYYASCKAICNAKNEIVDIVNTMVKEVLIKYPDLKTLFDSIDQLESLPIIDKEVFSEISDFSEIVSFNNNFEIAGDYNFYANPTGVYSLFHTPESNNTFTAKLNLSLSADAQNQRHRTAVGLRPDLNTEFEKINSFEEFISKQYIPEIFNQNEKALYIFIEAMKLTYEMLSYVNNEYKPYLLPNSFKIIILETNSVADFIHKSKMRLCLTAQEEIRYITENMVRYLKLKGFNGKLFVPPCVSRFNAGIKPTCSEGSRFCGIREWQKEKYKNL